MGTSGNKGASFQLLSCWLAVPCPRGLQRKTDVEKPGKMQAHGRLQKHQAGGAHITCEARLQPEGWGWGHPRWAGCPSAHRMATAVVARNF